MLVMCILWYAGSYLTEMSKWTYYLMLFLVTGYSQIKILDFWRNWSKSYELLPADMQLLSYPSDVCSLGSLSFPKLLMERLPIISAWCVLCYRFDVGNLLFLFYLAERFPSSFSHVLRGTCSLLTFSLYNFLAYTAFWGQIIYVLVKR